MSVYICFLLYNNTHTDSRESMKSMCVYVTDMPNGSGVFCLYLYLLLCLFML